MLFTVQKYEIYLKVALYFTIFITNDTKGRVLKL